MTTLPQQADTLPEQASESPSETLEQSLVRLTDVIGNLNPKRWGKHDEFDRVKFELPRMPWMNVHTLATLTVPPGPDAQEAQIQAYQTAQEIVAAKCNHCQADLQCRRIVSPFVACDACIEKHTTDEKMKRYQRYWESICPERYRATQTDHKDFPGPIYNELRKIQKENPSQSFFLYGPTGSCKTRVGMLLLKRAMLADGYVGVLWPEKLATLRESFGETRAFDHYANFHTLLLDDTLLTACREPKLTETLKQLIDVRMRHNRPFIITSQIGSEEDIAGGKEFGEAKAADLERIKALLRRFREECKVVNFAKVEPKAGEASF